MNSDTARRRADYVAVQQILERDLPAINLWYVDTVVVHNRRMTNVVPNTSWSHAFLESAALVSLDCPITLLPDQIQSRTGFYRRDFERVLWARLGP